MFIDYKSYKNKLFWNPPLYPFPQFDGQCWTLSELTDEMLAVVNQALRPQPSEEILVEGYKLQIRRRDMESLSGLNWLNDEVKEGGVKTTDPWGGGGMDGI